MPVSCSPLQRSLEWCMGTPELPGIRRRIYYISKDQIAQWPRYNRDANTQRANSAALIGSFVLVADAKWKYIDILAEKSQLTSEAQGEIPSQTQLNKLVAVHPGVGPEATAAACYLNNSDNVFIVEDMKGLFRVVGCNKWMTKTTVTQDNGQGPTGTTSTTINVEATDEVPAPFYSGVIETEDGDIDCTDIEDGNSGSGTASFNNTVTINGTVYDISYGAVSIPGPLTSIRFTGQNMDFIKVYPGTNIGENASMAANGASATWSGNVNAPAAVTVTHGRGDGNTSDEETWFTINVIPSGNNNNGGDNGGNNGGGDDDPFGDMD